RAIRTMRQPEARFITSFLYRPDSTSREVQVDWVYQRPERRRRPLRITALITDITARSRALKALKDREHELAERTDLLRITMDALDHGLAAFSPHNTLTEWNARFPAMLNLPSPLARNGTPAIAIFRFLATLGAFGVGVTEGKVRARMNRLLHAPNQDDVPWLGGRHLRFSAHTMPDGGWVWRIEDRTEDLRLRDIEQNRQKMEALGQLASGVAHELNNTLQPIFSLSELGLSQIDDGTLAARCFSRITDAAERAETIVRGVLTFARNAPASDENTRIIPAIHDAVAFIRTGLPPQIRLDVAVDDAIPAAAMARLDRRELGQVLTNLVTNAADAMDHAGVIRVECRGDLLIAPGDGDAADPGVEARPAVAIAVIDTGKGMDHATKQRIFEPFFTTKDEGHGTGLGLAVAFGIVRNWGGRIDVDSDPGLGSTFTVWVPLLETEAA
ncbi:MAG: nitrogen regulation protein NR(II), partial [Rhodospirillaceae bacterium]